MQEINTLILNLLTDNKNYLKELPDQEIKKLTKTIASKLNTDDNTLLDIYSYLFTLLVQENTSRMRTPDLIDSALNLFSFN